MRVVSLVPSVTETLLGWDVEPVAVTRFCEHPELTQVGGTKDPDVAAIVGLAPDLVVVCEEENRAADAVALQAAGLAVHVVRIDSVADVAPQLDRLAAAVGVARPDRVASIEVVPAGAGGSGAAPRPSAFVPIWRRPWMTLGGGCYGSSLLAAIGIANVFADGLGGARVEGDGGEVDGGGVDGVALDGDPVRYPTTTLAEARARRPDLVVAPSEPYPFGPRHVAELSAVAPVELVDGRDLFWWGIRTPAAVARLRERLADWSA